MVVMGGCGDGGDVIIFFYCDESEVNVMCFV